MKNIVFLLFTLVIVVLQGCIVKSLHPFYSQKDLVFRPDLVNSWVDEDNNRWIIKKWEETPNAYEMRWLVDGDRNVVFMAHLFELEGELYFDFIPVEDQTEGKQSFNMFDMHLVAVHSLRSTC